MSELQLSLLALAALALAGLYLGEKWQERRRLRRLRERLHGGVGDALLQPRAAGEAERRPGQRFAAAGPAGAAQAPGTPAPDAEVLSGSAAMAGAPAIPEAWAGGPAPQSEEGPDAAAAAQGDRVVSEPLATPAVLLRPDWAEDPLLDCSLEVRCARAVDGVSVIDAAAALAHGPWRLPVHFVVWDGRHQQWALPDRFGYYTDALASIQLASRRACIDEAEIGRFVQAVQRLAQDLGADVDQPDPARLVQQARELDQLCARFDIRIGITVESAGAPWTGPQLRNAAHERGFAPAGSQRWVRRAGDDPQGAALYSLAAEPSNATRLTLELDIALAPDAVQAFASMVDAARGLAAALGGRVVDDNGQPIEARSVQAIERQLVEVCEQMRSAGIEPGSTRALRLYG